jgi:hypothetical protein
MEWMTRSDIILLAIAAYVALMTLVRLMKQRRDVLVADVQKQVHAQRRAKKRQQEIAEQESDAA